MAGDTLSVETDQHPGEPLIELVMKNGRRVAPSATLAQIRERACNDLARLPYALSELERGMDYPVEIAPALVHLAEAVDRRLADERTALERQD
jgi:nicotinate phosphoribosyltransferase